MRKAARTFEQNAIIRLCAFLAREAGGANGCENVTLSADPETVHELVMRAKRERDMLYEIVRELLDACDRLMNSTGPPDDIREAMRKAVRMIEPGQIAKNKPQ